MQTNIINIFHKVKEFIKNIFKKSENDAGEVWHDLSEEVKLDKKEDSDELVACGFTPAPKHFSQIQKDKDLPNR